MPTVIERLSFPTEETHPGFDKLKRLAARVGRALGDADTYAGHVQALRDHLETLPYGQIPYYAQLTMLVPPNTHALATGQGGYWAHASYVVNEEARAILERRRREWREQHGDAMFVVVD